VDTDNFTPWDLRYWKLEGDALHFSQLDYTTNIDQGYSYFIQSTNDGGYGQGKLADNGTAWADAAELGQNTTWYIMQPYGETATFAQFTPVCKYWSSFNALIFFFFSNGSVMR
jgi:hypothetical protein